MKDLFGVLNLDKPPGASSRMALDVVARLVRPAKAGHAGTLDPLASGVLVVCIGPATRLIEYVQRMPKRYVGEFLIGHSSPTEDIEGEVVELPDAPRRTLDELQAAAVGLTGRIWQRPPAFSARKVAGKRAYKLARNGQQVELAPRSIDVYRLDVVRYDYPRFTLDIECGSGTYIRSLGRDLAEAVGSSAVMTGLVRTAIGPFAIEQAIAPDALMRETLAAHILPATAAVAGLPRLRLNAAEADDIARGLSIDRPEVRDSTGEWSAIDADGRLVSILVRRRDNRLGPRLNFSKPT